MSITPRSAVTAAAFVAAGALGATLLTGVAGAAGTAGTVPAADPSPSVSSPSTQVPARGGLLRSVLHGQITVADGDGTAVVAVQRGEIVSASATSVTVRSSDGYEHAYAIDGGTRVRRDRADADGSALQKGDIALVRARGGTAEVVRALSPEALERLTERAAGAGGMLRSRGVAAGTGAGDGSGVAASALPGL